MEETEKIEKKDVYGKNGKKKEKIVENKIFFQNPDLTQQESQHFDPEFFPSSKNESNSNDFKVKEGASAKPNALDIDTFSRVYKLTKAEIWQLVGAGELIAQRIGARIIIAKDWFDAEDIPVMASESLVASRTVHEEWQGLIQDKDFSIKSAVKSKNLDDQKLRPENSASESHLTASNKITGASGEEKKKITNDESGYAVQQSSPSDASSEMVHEEAGKGYLVVQDQTAAHIALLIDHLSLAKEENREILKLTQSSIEQITKTTEAIILAKDALIQKHETEGGDLKEKLADFVKAVGQKDAEITNLKQQIEDLQMLTKALSEREKTN